MIVVNGDFRPNEKAEVFLGEAQLGLGGGRTRISSPLSLGKMFQRNSNPQVPARVKGASASQLSRLRSVHRLTDGNGSCEASWAAAVLACKRAEIILYRRAAMGQNQLWYEPQLASASRRLNFFQGFVQPASVSVHSQLVQSEAVVQHYTGRHIQVCKRWGQCDELRNRRAVRLGGASPSTLRFAAVAHGISAD